MKSNQSTHQDNLKAEFVMVNQTIHTLECNFNQITDDDLVDYYIMLLQAEQAKRNFLIKQIKGERVWST